jgi:hypothetical protein
MFVAVVETGSFTQAARQLGVSPGQASKLIARLEADLGVQSLMRSTRAIAAKELGSAYYERVRALLGEYEALDGGIARRRARRRGDDLAGLGPMWADRLPDTAFASPDGADPFDHDPTGQARQWFSVTGVTPHNRFARIVAARDAFDRCLAEIVERHGFAGRLDRVAMAGFSQGSIMALDAVVSGRSCGGGGGVFGPVGLAADTGRHRNASAVDPWNRRSRHSVSGRRRGATGVAGPWHGRGFAPCSGGAAHDHAGWRGRCLFAQPSGGQGGGLTGPLFCSGADRCHGGGAMPGIWIMPA